MDRLGLSNLRVFIGTIKFLIYYQICLKTHKNIKFNIILAYYLIQTSEPLNQFNLHSNLTRYSGKEKKMERL